MKGWALDASTALAWALPDERSEIADGFFERIETDEVLVPALFWYEVTNAVAVARRRARMTPADGDRLLHLLSLLPLRTDAGVGQSSMAPIGNIARANRLSAYDAAYLELAARRGLGLATLDERLASAARGMGIELFGALAAEP